MIIAITFLIYLCKLKILFQIACKGPYFKAWYKSLGVSKYVIGSIMGFIGLFFVFLGNKYFKIACSVIIMVATALISQAIFDPIFQFKLPCKLSFFELFNIKF